MADRNTTTWDRERTNEREDRQHNDRQHNDWQREDWRREDWQREEARRREREFGGGVEPYREDRPEDRRPYRDFGNERRAQSMPRGDYGPGAFNPGGGRDNELFGTGNRGYGTTWGGSGVYHEGRSLYQGDQRNYPLGEQGHTGGQTGEFGPHAGKGPKGYRRADERIREDVCDALTRHAHVDASEIEIRVKDGEVTLTGTVDRREEKRLAEDAAESVQGVREVHNQLRAQSPGAGQNNVSREEHLETAGNATRRR